MLVASLCVVALHFLCVLSELFTSTSELHQLHSQYLGITDVLHRYVHEEEERLKTITRLLDDDIHKVADDVDFIEHPVNAFNFVEKWFQINSLTRVNNTEGSLDELDDLELPTQFDYIGTLYSLVRLQRVYQLDTDDLLRGQVKGYRGGPMDVAACVDLAAINEIAANEEIVKELVHHLKKTLTQVLHSEDHNNESMIIYNREWNENLKGHKYTVHGNIANYTYIYNNTIQDGILTYNSDLLAPAADNHTFEDEDNDTWRAEYEALCRGEKMYRDPDVVSTLICRYVYTWPYAVVKEEVLNWDPKISLFHDVISHGNVDYMISKAEKNMWRARVGDSLVPLLSEKRIGKMRWLWDDKRLTELTNDISRITKLNTTISLSMSSSEPYQICNYGIGGQYEPHLDFYRTDGLRERVAPFLQGTGDRAATFMYYLKSPLLGGATVFPQLNITIPAVPNAAAFWYNMNKAGEYDERTLHAGCPVLIGEKWIANKWIREAGQMFNRPCGLKVDDNDP